MRLSDLLSLRVGGVPVSTGVPLPSSDAGTHTALALLATDAHAAAILAALQGTLAVSGPLTAAQLAAAALATHADSAAILAKLSADPSTGGGQTTMIAGLSSIDGHVDGLEAATGAPADAAWSGSGSGGIIAVLKAIWAAVTGTLKFQSTNPATIYTDQQAVTASAVALTAQALVNGCVIKAKSTNAGKVFIGGASVTTTDDGTGNGYPLEAGEAVSFGVTNCSALYIIGTAGDVVYVAGN